MGISILLAFLGWFVAHLFYSGGRSFPTAFARALGGLYEAVVHKYYIDELYSRCSSLSR